MNYRKIVIIGYVELNEVLSNILYIKELKKKFEVKYIFFNTHYKYKNKNLKKSSNDQIEITNINNLLNLINKYNINETLISFIYIDNLKYLYALYLLKKKGYLFYNIQYVLPDFKDSLSKIEKLFIKISYNINSLLNLKFFLIKILNYYIFKNIILFSNYKNFPNSFRINFFDIDLQKMQKINEFKLPDKFALLLDSHIHDGTDSKLNGYETVNYKIHYNGLKNFIKKFEKQSGMPLIISGHPKYRSSYSNIFKNRKVFFNCNSILISRAQYVFVFDSSSVYYAIYKYKKIIFLFSDEIKRVSNIYKYPKFQQINFHSKTINAPLLKFDNQLLLTNIMKFINFDVDTKLYKKFIDTYLYNKKSMSILSKLYKLHV